MIRLRDFQVTRAGQAVCAVAKLNVLPGARLGIVGANGSGKSTLLRVLAGLDSGYSGECEIEPDVAQRVFVHHDPWMFRGTVRGNVAWGLPARERASEADVEPWLDCFDLQSLREQPAARLSAGEKKRVALARAMAIRPKLLLLDEPLAELDEAGAAGLAAALEEMTETTVILSSPRELPPDCVSEHFTLARPGTG